MGFLAHPANHLHVVQCVPAYEYNRLECWLWTTPVVELQVFSVPVESLTPAAQLPAEYNRMIMLRCSGQVSTPPANQLTPIILFCTALTVFLDDLYRALLAFYIVLMPVWLTMSCHVTSEHHNRPSRSQSALSAPVPEVLHCEVLVSSL